MHTRRMRLVASTFLLVLGIVSGIIVANGHPSAFQNKSPDVPRSPHASQNSESNAPVTTMGSPASTQASSKPHYFHQTGNSSARALASAPQPNSVTYHGGPTMHISISYAIFWLPSGNSFEPASGNNSAYMSLIDRFLNDTSGTAFYNILNQYPDNVNGTPLDKSVLAASYLDTTPYPVAGTQARPLHDTDIQAEVKRAIMVNNWAPGPDKIFHIFTGYGIESCFDPNNCTYNAFCAYHDAFTQNSQPVIYSNMPDFGIFRACNIAGQPTPNQDPYADPEINILSHELFEAVSDPIPPTAWVDSSLSEIGDKCAWTFGNISPDGSNLVINGHKYLVQLEWSNFDGCTLSYGPTHQVTITPSPGSNPIASTSSFNITYSSQGSTWWTTTAYANGTLSVAVDQNTPVAITRKNSTASQNEKWCFDQTCTNASFGSGSESTTTYYYYDLLAQQVSVSTGAASPTASLDYATGATLPDTLGLPQQLTVQLTQTIQTIWAQRGTTASVASPTNIGIDTRWAARVSSWTISSALQIPNPIIYYPQYLTTFQYTVSGGGAYSPPFVTYYDASLLKTALAGTPVWADSGGAYDYQSQLSGSTPYERWSTITPQGIVTAPGTSISPSYYHQYAVTASYHLSDGNAPTVPSMTGEAYGLTTPITIPLQPSITWLDANSAFSLANSIPGSSDQERWYTASPSTGVVNSPIVMSLVYNHQYFLTLTGAQPGTTGQGWYNAGLDATITTPLVSEISPTSRILLVSYSEDSGPPTLVTSMAPSEISVSLLMRAPHTLQFASQMQYYLANTIQTSSIGSMTLSPTGDSWYNNGTTVSIVLTRNWDATDNTRQSLISYLIDNVPTSIDRLASGPVDMPLISMTQSHVLSEGFVTQYLISVQGATLSGSQTGDGWIDSGSQFTIQGTYAGSYTADTPYHGYAVQAGFQILANTTLSSLVWTSSSSTLSFSGNNIDATIYIPGELNLIPTAVSDNGATLSFVYSSSTHLLTFKGSSSFQISLSSTAGTSSLLPNVSDSILYPAIIGIIVGVILIAGLLLIRRQPRKSQPN